MLGKYGVIIKMGQSALITACIWRMGEGNVFTGVCPFRGEGVPNPLVPGPF